jgi:uncharacterized repeat protein (TIGR03803 family)
MRIGYSRRHIWAAGFAGFLIVGFVGAIGTASAAKLKTLRAFCARADCRDGDTRAAGLVMDATGNLYGASENGGAYGEGAIFQLSKVQETGRWKERVIHSFCKEGFSQCKDGHNPWGSLVLDVNGNLYGNTMAGPFIDDPSVVFELMPDSDRKKWRVKVLYHFCSRATQKSNCADGDDIFRSGLAYQGQADGVPFDGVSPLYGAAAGEGRHSAGVVFQLTPVTGKSKWKERVLYAFCAKQNCADGERPWGRLVVDHQGNLFGVAGELEKPGVAYEMSQTEGHWQETVLHRFCQEKNCEDGANPNALVIDGQGALLGTTYGGGANDWGTIFKIVPSGENSAYQVLYSFCSQPDCADGGAPYAGLTVDSSGDLFGPTGESDEPLPGTVFRFSQGGTLTTLHQFCTADCNDGEFPESELLLGPNNTLFGTTLVGGKHGSDNTGGTVFQITY